MKKPPVTTVTVRVPSAVATATATAAAPAAASMNDVTLTDSPTREAAVRSDMGSLPITTGASLGNSPASAAAPEGAPLAGSPGGSPAAGTGEDGTPAAPWETPVAVYAPAPEYPLLARQQGWEGEVLLEAVILPDGRVDSVRILSSSGHPALDNAARKAVVQWLYPPLQPPDTKSRRLTVHLVFRLRENP